MQILPRSEQRPIDVEVGVDHPTVTRVAAPVVDRGRYDETVLRIVLGTGGLASYQEGGGHWSWFLQYPLGLRALGKDVVWLEVMASSGERARDERVVRDLFQRLAAYGLDRECVVAIFPGNLDVQAIDECEIVGRSRADLLDLIRSADLLLNFACAVRSPLLSMFKRRALLDFDPGHLQLSALDWDLALREHDVALTIGARIHAPDCMVPTLGLTWRTFEPIVYLPMWTIAPDPGPQAPFTSVTQWTWHELAWQGRPISISKRAAYLEYLDLPRLSRRPFELAANIGAEDPAGDRALLQNHGWRLADPHEVSGSPEQYREYIASSRAEFMCAKPIHVAMRTGWFSDRSVAYLASGRPVLAQETGFGERLPTGRGLLAFRDMPEALAGVAEIDGNYAAHCGAARELAEAFFDSTKSLAALLAACDG